MIKIKSRGKLRIIVSVFLILCAIILLGFISPLRIKKYNLTFCEVWLMIYIAIYKYGILP